MSLSELSPKQPYTVEQATPPPPTARPGAGSEPEARVMSGKYSSILIAFAMTALTMTIIPAALLCLIFANRLTHGATLSVDLQTPVDTAQGRASGIYYVNISATTLVFLSSLMSTLASVLVASLMLLFSYPAMSRILAKSRLQGDDLPTPFQLNLLVQLFRGGLGALWSWLTYLVEWRGKRARIATEVNLTAAFSVAAIALGLLISVADTWLHLTTQSVQYSRITAQPAVEHHEYGRGLSEYCVQAMLPRLTGNRSCTAMGGNLLNESDVFNTLYDLSPANRIHIFNDTISRHTYALIAAPSPDPAIDFTASTFALSTQCTLITRACNLRLSSSVSYPFDCKSVIDFGGDLFSSSSAFLFRMFNSSAGSDTLTYPDAANPFYWALASMTPGVYGADVEDPEIDTTYKGTGTVLWCNTTVHEVVYSSVNGSVAGLAPSAAAAGRVGNTTLGGLFAQAMEVAPGFWQPAARDAMQKAVLRLPEARDPAAMLLDEFPAEFSRIAAAFGAPGLGPRENVEEQVRGSLIVASVQVAPLFMVVVLGFMYALLAAGLAVVALCTGEGVHDAVAKLGISGIVALGFERERGLGEPVEKIEELYEEWAGKGTARVSIRKTEAGWGYGIVGGK
ncbi:hypothetical protein B0H67DRAFT_321678 [Lasiosphaeris hirsuta]|uniref:Uncharacterized protein n=1 Tax=Lasiosphaeris hirsuta TaxID=260670 RepID=A0AA40A1U4_9PEZI|nr:hypothetical protein B0H67DRAFT_321678 [Lasiosphaeris hirsuta]